jgi:hypothetical protein
MGQKPLLLSATLALAALAGVALHYRSQARLFEERWRASVAQLEEQALAPRPVPPALHAETVWRVPLPTVAAASASQTRTAAPVSNETAAAEDDTGPDASAVSDAWLAELQRTNPQLYEQMKLRSRLPRQRSRPAPPQAQQSWDRAIVYFSNRNTAALSPQALAEYQGLLNMLQDTWSLQQQVYGELSMEDRRAVMAAVQENIARLGPMLECERNQEYHDLAVGMGLSEADATAMVGYINQIASNTAARTIFATGGNALGGRRGTKP